MGFPSEENVGYEVSDKKAWLILHHNLRLAENEKFHEEFFTYIKSGDYPPEHIFVWYEQFQMQVKGQTFFTTWDKDLSEEKLKRVDANLRKFFMKGLNAFEIKKNGRSMFLKW